MPITQEIIDSVRKINLEEFDVEEQEKIRLLHKKLLEHSMKYNESNEVGLLVSLKDWEYIVSDSCM